MTDQTPNNPTEEYIFRNSQQYFSTLARKANSVIQNFQNILDEVLQNGPTSYKSDTEYQLLQERHELFHFFVSVNFVVAHSSQLSTDLVQESLSILQKQHDLLEENSQAARENIELMRDIKATHKQAIRTYKAQGKTSAPDYHQSKKARTKAKPTPQNLSLKKVKVNND